jgi:hypothetical protein
LKEENMKGNIKGKERKRGKIGIRWMRNNWRFTGGENIIFVAGGGGENNMVFG